MIARFLHKVGSGERPASLFHWTGSIRLANASSDRAYNYRTPAYIPGNDWEELKEVSGCVDQSEAGVSLFHLANFWEKLRLHGIELSEDPMAPVLEADQIRVAKCVLPLLGDFLVIGENLKPFGLFRHAGRMLTTTIDPSGHRTGLHLDSWLGESMTDRAARPGRLVLNLGPGSRYFYAVAPNVSDRLGDVELSPTEVVLDILENDPSLRVIRLTVGPGYGYIANTENQIHDGSTIDSEAPSYTYTIMGNFNSAKYADAIVYECP